MYNNESEIKQLIDKSLEKILQILPERLKLSRKKKSGFAIKCPPTNVMQEYDITKYLNFKKYNNTLKKFERVLKEDLSHCDHSAFYQNLKKFKLSTQISPSDRMYRFFNPYVIATYDGKKNHAVLYNEEKLKTEDSEDLLTHELIHMATTRQKKDHYFCGFKQYNEKYQLGVGLNEGYTEYLNRKYFSNNKKEGSYPKERHLARGLEKIIGQEKMEQLFFASDLYGLVMELSKYAPINEIVRLIDKMDRMTINGENLYTELKRDIVLLYSEKQLSELNAGRITDEQFDKRIKYVTVAYLSDVLVSDDPEIIESDDKIVISDKTQKSIINKDEIIQYSVSNEELSSMLDENPNTEDSNNKKK